MKVSIYIDKNTKQINLESEDKYESEILESFSDKNTEVVFSKGKFQECNGGYTRLYDTYTDQLIMYIKEIKGE